LDDLFNHIYYTELQGVTATSNGTQPDLIQHQSSDAIVSTTVTQVSGLKRTVDSLTIPEPSPLYSSSNGHDDNQHHDLFDDMDPKELTAQQKIEKRERNREHAKRSRLRKRFLLESLQEQIHGLEEQLENLKYVIRTELPLKSEEIITTVCGDKKKYTPLPMPSGFGPVKTLMEPDFRLSKYLDIL
jgi:hypothetical protein